MPAQYETKRLKRAYKEHYQHLCPLLLMGEQNTWVYT